MGNLFSSNNTRQRRFGSDIYMNSLKDPLLDPQSLEELVSKKTESLQEEFDRLKVELKSCRDENRTLKSDLQKLQTNYGKEIYTLGENCSNLTQDTSDLMKNQELIRELLTKILQTQEKSGVHPDASLYASVNSLKHSSESHL